MEAAVRTEALTKDYGSGRGVFELDLEVREGEILGFLGPNGAGKSTTMRVLLGLARPTAGRAELLGHDVVADGLAARRRVGYLAGDFELYDQLSGADVLAYFARLRGGVERARIGELAERFGADLERPVRELSTGNRGAWMLRRDVGDRTEFITYSLWDSLDAIRGFAGDDIEAAVYYPEDERFLIEQDDRVKHYEIVAGS